MVIGASWDQVEQDYKTILKGYSSMAVKGFRPGKTPPGMIESMFREQIKSDLLASVSRRLCRTALQQQGLEAGSPLELSECELDKGREFKFTANFIEMPEFRLPDYAHLGITAADPDGMIDEISIKLLELTPIELHPSLIENEMDYSDPEQAGPEAEQAAADRIRLMMTLKRIASENGIEIDERDIRERIERVAGENDATPAQLREYLVAGQGLSRLADALLAEAVLGYLIEIQK